MATVVQSLPAGGSSSPNGESWGLKHRESLLLALAIAIFAAYPIIDSWLGLGRLGSLGPMMIYVILAMGLNVVVGYAGLLDLGYAAFFAIGAYTMGFLTSLTSVFVQRGYVPEWLQHFWPALAFSWVTAAVFGILLMNIVAFAMPAAAYLNPTAYLGDRLSTHIVWALSHLLADQKFMGLFSLLFGSSVMLLTQKLEQSGRPPARFFYARTFWLLVFGLLHGWLLWEGDILVYYAFCGFLLYPLRKLTPALQFGLGLAIFLSAIAVDRLGQNFLENLSPFALEGMEPTWSPSNLDIAFETSLRLAPYGEQLDYRSALPARYGDHYMDVISNIYVAQGLLRAFGMMLVGMAFFSWGIVSGQRGPAFYRRCMLLGFGIGLPLASYGLWQNYAEGWSLEYGLYAGLVYNHLATPLVVCGYIGLLVTLQLQQSLPRLRRGLCAVGRMAFSNYIGQSLICTTLFYGYGLALFGQLDRIDLLLIVIAIWIFQFYFSLTWLHHFRLGPLEWLWRILTYLEVPPLRRQHGGSSEKAIQKR